MALNIFLTWQGHFWTRVEDFKSSEGCYEILYVCWSMQKSFFFILYVGKTLKLSSHLNYKFENLKIFHPVCLAPLLYYNHLKSLKNIAFVFRKSNLNTCEHSTLKIYDFEIWQLCWSQTFPEPLSFRFGQIRIFGKFFHRFGRIICTTSKSNYSIEDF